MNASLCRANCLEGILRGRGWDPGRPRASDGGPALKTSRSHNRAHWLLQKGPLTLVAHWNITTYIQLEGMEVRSVYAHAAHYQGV